MLQFQTGKGVELCDGLTRRNFLRVGTLGAGAIGLTLADLQQLPGGTGQRDVNCIILFLVGGPSQLDTWDLKPNAPENVRGPFRPICTNVPGIVIGEHFPRMARMAHRYALLRSVHHTASPIHETGHQLMQTGQLFQDGLEHPHYGSVLSYLRGARTGAAPYVVLPAAIGNTGVGVGHAQGAGYLGARHKPVEVAGDLCLGGDLTRESDDVRERYGRNTFGQSCLLSRRLIERGTRLVTVNMFDTVFNRITWDCHADGGALPATLDDYKDTLCPQFDRAYTALLDDLSERGLLETTLVVAMGEFGRTPQLNARGGRDHWPGVWTVLFAGADVRGGQVIGASDAMGAEPHDRPISPAMIAASVYRALGMDPGTRLPAANGVRLQLVVAEPIEELFRG